MKKVIFLLVVLMPFISKSQVNIIGYVAPFGLGQYPTHADSLGYGGYRVAKDTFERNLITSQRRKKGMAVYVQSNNKMYILNDSTGLNNWTEFTTSSITKAVDSIYRKVAKDSIFYRVNNIEYAIKDSSGGGGTLTRAVDTIYRTPSKDSIFFTIGGTLRKIKDSIGVTDTANKYVNAITRQIGKDSIIFYIGSTRYAIKDSSGVPAGSDTTSLSNRINSKADTFAVKLKLNISDTIAFVRKTRSISTTSPLQGGGSLNGDLTLSIPVSSNVASGYLSSSDWLTFYNKANNTISINANLGGGANLSGGGNLTTSRTIEIPKATTSIDGYLSASDYITFAGKQGALTPISPIQISGSLLSSRKANYNDSGYLSAIDYNKFAKKVDTIYKNATNDSIVYTIDNRRNAIQSGGGSDTSKVIIAEVHNADATTLLRGDVVYLFGANGDRASVKKASNKSDTTSSKTFGFVRDSIQAGGIGFIVTQGQIGKLNLSAYTPGQILYLDSIPGKFTTSKPVAPLHQVFLGVVEKANAGNGLIYVKPQNGYELDEIHNVLVNGSKNNSLLYYDSLNKLWKASQLTFAKNASKDSMIINYGGARYAVKDSTGIVSASSPLYITNPTTNPTINIYQATSSVDGYLSTGTYNAFNAKVDGVFASGLLTSSGGQTPTISTSMSAGKLVGRNPSTSGAMQEITIGSGLTLSGTTLTANAGSAGSQNLQSVLTIGDTLNQYFHFRTNGGDSLIQLNGSTLTQNRLYDFPNASGTLALTSMFAVGGRNVDLTTGNETLDNERSQYIITKGTDSASPYKLIFSSPASKGQRITIVNADNTSFNNALIDTSSVKPRYQGSDKTIWNIPYGMTYEFVSDVNTWYCTSPTPPYTQYDISLWDFGGSTGLPYNIQVPGIYRIYYSTDDKDSYITFPDPKKNDGQKIIVANDDSTWFAKIEDPYRPIYKNIFGNIVGSIPPQTTYEFISIDSQWVCTNSGNQPTIKGIDLTSNNYKMQSNGVYTISNASTNDIVFPNPLEFDGKTIIVINKDNTNNAGIDASYQPEDASGTSITDVPSSTSSTFVSIDNKWIIISQY